MKSKKTITYSIFIICLTISSSITFPLLSSQSLAQAAKGNCASAAQRELEKRPVIFYTNKPLKMGSDNRYFIYASNPPEYGKEVELTVKGLTNWEAEELYANTAYASGDKIIIKSSTIVVIHCDPNKNCQINSDLKLTRTDLNVIVQETDKT
jgi:hypothetical protein